MKVQHQRQPTFTSIFFIINFLTKREKKYLCFFLLLQSLSRRFKSLSSYRFSRWPLRFIGHDLYRQHTQKNRHCPVHHSTAGHRDKARARVRVGKEKIADCIAINSHWSVINLLAEVSTVDLVQCTIKNRWFTLSHNLRKDQWLGSTRTLRTLSSSILFKSRFPSVG